MKLATIQGPLEIGLDYHRYVPAAKMDQAASPALNYEHPHNIGDWFVTKATDRLLAYDELLIIRRDADREWDAINDECEALVLKGGNYIQADWLTREFGIELFRKVKIPIILFGVGLQAGKAEQVRFEPEEIEILRYIHDSSACSSLRGNSTAEALESIGITNFVVTACPTAYWSRQPELSVRPPSDDSAGFSFRQSLYSEDPAVYEAQFRAIETVRDRFGSVTVILQGEEVLLQRYMEARRWGAEHEARLLPVPGTGLTRLTRTPLVAAAAGGRDPRTLRPLHQPPGVLDWFMNNSFFSYDIGEIPADLPVPGDDGRLPVALQPRVAGQRHADRVPHLRPADPGAGGAAGAAALRPGRLRPRVRPPRPGLAAVREGLPGALRRDAALPRVQPPAPPAGRTTVSAGDPPGRPSSSPERWRSAPASAATPGSSATGWPGSPPPVPTSSSSTGSSRHAGRPRRPPETTCSALAAGVMAGAGMDGRYALLFDGGRRSVGLDRRPRATGAAPLLFNVMGYLDDQDVLAAAAPRVTSTSTRASRRCGANSACTTPSPGTTPSSPSARTSADPDAAFPPQTSNGSRRSPPSTSPPGRPWGVGRRDVGRSTSWATARPFGPVVHDGVTDGCGCTSSAGSSAARRFPAPARAGPRHR